MVVARTFEQARQRTHVVGSKHHINPRSFLQQQCLVFLSETATHSNLQILVLFFHSREVTEVSVELVVGIFTNSTGVDDNNIWLN